MFSFWYTDIATTEPPVQSDPSILHVGPEGTEAPSLVALGQPAKKRRHAEVAESPSVALVIIYRSLGQLLPENYDLDRRTFRCSGVMHNQPGANYFPITAPFIYLTAFLFIE